MNELNLAIQRNYNNVTCDFYSCGNEMFMTRSQVGKALEYDEPTKSIDKIHSRHKGKGKNITCWINR